MLQLFSFITVVIQAHASWLPENVQNSYTLHAAHSYHIKLLHQEYMEQCMTVHIEKLKLNYGTHSPAAVV